MLKPRKEYNKSPSRQIAKIAALSKP
jgi:hypothetical protein